MTTNTKTRLYALPRDESLQAYKDWISGFYKFLIGKPVTEEDMSEEQWIEDHQKFWVKVAETGAKTGETNA